jgi:hypothetical protein
MSDSEKKITGAWILHHARKLDQVTHQPEFQQLHTAGRTGRMLSGISGTQQHTLSMDQVRALAATAGVTPLELPALLQLLKSKALIDTSDSGIAVLGLTSHSVLERTADIFNEFGPTTREKASLYLAERAAETPQLKSEILVEISDLFKLQNASTASFLTSAESIGFVDTEALDSTSNIYFNGNLLRSGEALKIKRALDTLTPPERQKVRDLEERLSSAPCVSVEDAKALLGLHLYNKMVGVGMFDVTVVTNEGGDFGYLSRPAAFGRYGTLLIDDALDLAKAFVSSLTYGMTKSPSARGQIRMIEQLMGALVRGEWVGPVDAIGRDYRALEIRGVVEVKSFNRNGRFGPNMRLLKRDVGKLALDAVRSGSVSSRALTMLPGADVVDVREPERNREAVRHRKTARPSSENLSEVLAALRTGRG